MNIQILPRGNFLKIIGENTNVDLAANVLIKLYNQAVKSNNIDVGEIIGTINILKNTKIDKNFNDPSQQDSIIISAGKKIIKPRSKKQVDYFNMVKKKQMVFQKFIFPTMSAMLCSILMKFVGISRMFSENGRYYEDLQNVLPISTKFQNSMKFSKPKQ